MNLDNIRELIRLMKEHGLSEVDVEAEGERIRLKAEPPAGAGMQPAQSSVHVYAPHPSGLGMPLHALPPGAGAAPSELHPGHQPASPEPDQDPGVVITSPIVGLFYASPAPDKPPFVQAGDRIDENTVLCIIEAMKVMNEIKAETSGTLRKVLPTNGQSVEYGQPLFVIDPA